MRVKLLGLAGIVGALALSGAVPLAVAQGDTGSGGEGPQILTADLARRQTITADTFRVNFVVLDEDQVVEVSINGEKQSFAPDQAVAITKEIDNRREQTVVKITVKNRAGKTREKSFLVLNPSAKGRFGEAAPAVVIQQDSWKSAGALKTPRAAPAAVAYGDSVYVFGGYTKLFSAYDTGMRAQIDKSEYVTTSEVFGANKPAAVMNDAPSFGTLASAAVFNGKIYVFESRRKLHVYDPKSSSWKMLESPIQLNRIGPAAVSGDFIYILGGLFGFSSKNAEGKLTIETRVSPLFWRYAPATNTWVAQGYQPLPREGLTACAVLEQIYVFGGLRDDKPLDRVDVYSTATNTWSLGTPMPVARAYASCTVVNGRVLVFGGQTAVNGEPIANVDEFIPSTNSWLARSAAPTARSQTAAVLLKDTAYLAGGFTTKPLDVTEAYR
jgi:hypothetical protein